MNVLVTGGAGFIGSHLVDRLVADGHDVSVIDNMSGGSLEFIKGHIGTIDLANADITTETDLENYMEGVEAVFHLAADPDVRGGFDRPAHQLDQNLIGTFNVLEASARSGVRTFCFTSTSTVYGNATVVPTPEDYGPLLPISVYGATKLACEGLISAYADNYGIDAPLFRFANVVGPRSTHGVIFDFVHKLRRNPADLEILGDGSQRKSYFYIDDCVEAMVHGWRVAKGAEAFNIGSADTIDVTRLADIVVDVMGLRNVWYRYTGGVRGAGWKGDVKYMHLAIDRMRALGWEPELDSSGAVRKAAERIVGEVEAAFAAKDRK
ncbi:MAG: NAD-dependent epimerase/dehydratase family protein [Thermoplasmata archaeon]|nr:NAD-dependent epimerase/dehydratase family protein [Thermoplasmata archaeon]